MSVKSKFADDASVPERRRTTKSGFVDVSMGVSQCRYLEGARRLSLRGWVSEPRLTTRIAVVRADGTPLGEGYLNENRLDIARKFGHDADSQHGFAFDIDAVAREGDTIHVIAFAEGDRRLAQATAKVALFQPFVFETVNYDTAAKILEIEGYFVPAKQMRGMKILLSRGRAELVQHVFVHRPDVSKKFPAIANHYTGFRTRLFHIGQGDLMHAQLSVDYVDGTSQVLSLPIDAVNYDVTKTAVTELAIDWLDDRFRVAGWYRSFEPITRVEIALAGQICHGFVAVKQNNQVVHNQKLVGIPVYEFEIQGSISEIFESPEKLILAARLDVELSLFSRSKLSHKATLEPERRELRSTTIDFAAFDRQNSTLVLKGRYAAAMRPVAADVTLNGVEVGRGLEVIASVHASSTEIATGSWTCVHDINGAIASGSTICVELLDGGRLHCGRASVRGSKIIIIDGWNNLSGMDAPSLASVYSRWNLSTFAKLPENTVLFAYPGSAQGAFGGALTRMLQIMCTLKESGYSVALVDRTAAWEISGDPKRYSALMRIVDHHFMLPSAMRSPMLGQAITAAQERPAADGFALELMNAMKAIHKSPPGALPQTRSILDRADPYFNMLSAFIANILKPRVFISTYVWSAEAHRHLDPAIVGFLDLIDLQFDRLRIFTEARARFGETAVPSLEKYAVDQQKEIAAINLAKHVIAISPEEHAQLVPLVGAHRLVSLGMGTDHPALPRGGVVPPRVLFVGNDYEPNVFSLQRFIDEQWGRIRSEVSEAELVIVGSVCGKLRIDSAGIVVFDRVSRIEEFYAQAAVVVNPVLFGSGISIKTIEALGFGMATVCTPEGARGLPDVAVHGAGIVVPFDQIGTEIIHLLTHEDARAELEGKALEYARSQLAPGVVSSDFMNFLETKLFY